MKRYQILGTLGLAAAVGLAGCEDDVTDTSTEINHTDVDGDGVDEQTDVDLGTPHETMRVPGDDLDRDTIDEGPILDDRDTIIEPGPIPVEPTPQPAPDDATPGTGEQDLSTPPAEPTEPAPIEETPETQATDDAAPQASEAPADDTPETEPAGTQD